MSETPIGDDVRTGGSPSRHNVFEQTDAPSDGNEISVLADNKRLRREIFSGKGLPCMVSSCRCICEHRHVIYDGNVKPDPYNPREALVQDTHLHCPVHGKDHNATD